MNSPSLYALLINITAFEIFQIMLKFNKFTKHIADS